MKHRELYNQVNKHASDIASVCPDMSPLHVLRGAIQQHQMKPVAPGNSKDTVQVMPDIHVSLKPSSEWSDKVERLSVVLPDIPKSTLKDMIGAENGNLDAIVSKVFGEDESDAYPSKTPYECAVDTSNSTISDQCDAAKSEYSSECHRIATAATSISNDNLKSIISTVYENENQQQQARVLSFHKPERSTVNVLDGHPSNSWSELLSSQDTTGLCPECQSMIDLKCNFCPNCGYLMKKNYRRL